MSLVELLLRLKTVEPVVLTQIETPVNTRLRAAGIEVIVGPKELVGSGFLPKLRFSWWLNNWLGSREFKLVHVNDLSAYLHSIAALRWQQLPVVFNLRDTFPPHRKYGWHWRSLAFCQRIITLSWEMQSSLIKRLPLPTAKRNPAFINFVYSIVDFDRFLPVRDQDEKLYFRRSLGLPLDRTLIAYVAKVSPKKQQLSYIEQALPQLTAKYCTVFVGDYRVDENEYAKKCASAVSVLSDQDSYYFAGFQEQVEDFYRACDLVVVPTEREGLARCMIEGLSCGLPIVSFDVCSAHEILVLQEPLGEVVPQGNYQALVNAIKTSPLEVNQRAYHQSLELFSAEAAVAAYEAIYWEVIGLS